MHQAHEQGREGALVLKDGAVFRGELLGAAKGGKGDAKNEIKGEASGEVVFNTAMSGYEEVLTDPSYHRQIVVMTQPEIGNYGITLDDEESFDGPKVAGFVIRSYNRASNHRALIDLEEYLKRHRVVALTGVDTRRLTLYLREHGSQPGLITAAPLDAAIKKAAALPTMNGQNLAAEVTTPASYNVGAKQAKLHVVLIDFGAKRNIAHLLATRGCRVTVVPCTASGDEIRALRPDGIVLSNGPGDPAATEQAIATVKALLGHVPIFGICLGHQLLGLAVGAKTYKLKFGHRGANQPVLDLATKRIFITSQNHGFCVDPETLPVGATATHLNLSDGTLEGFAYPEKMVSAVQFHPEASPGPHDASPIFDEFVRLMTARA